MEPARASVRRCAVYTRKSSEEGLENDFNSLHAQREACEAFIRSQQGDACEGRHLDHWLQAEHELIAEISPDFEFTQLMRAFRSDIISETTVEQVMTDLEKRAISDGIRISSRLGNLIDRG